MRKHTAQPQTATTTTTIDTSYHKKVFDAHIYACLPVCVLDMSNEDKVMTAIMLDDICTLPSLKYTIIEKMKRRKRKFRLTSRKKRFLKWKYMNRKNKIVFKECEA
jgi:hypothetical protein